MSSDSLLILLLVILAADYLFSQRLDFLNSKSRGLELPDRLKGLYEEEEYVRSQLYQKTKARFSFITSGFGFLLSFSVLLLGGFGWLDEALRQITEDPQLLPLLFFGAIFFASDLITLPFQLYSVFVIEEKFDFNRMTAKTFALDKLKGLMLTVLIGGGIGYALLWLINELGTSFWWSALLLIGGVSIIANLLYTSLILPLFNKLTPLEDGELKEQISTYAQKVSFPLDNIFVIDGSKRSSKANAFFSGLGKRKKVVLYDTLIEKQSTEELVAIFAHEVGHYKKKHILTSLVLSLISTGVTLFIFSLLLFNEELSLALGGQQQAVHLNVLAFGMLYAPISRLTGLFMNVLSRKNEYEADAFAAETYSAEPLQTALEKLSVTSLSNLTPHPAYVFVHYSHPTLLQRLEALDLLKKFT